MCHGEDLTITKGTRKGYRHGDTVTMVGCVTVRAILCGRLPLVHGGALVPWFSPYRTLSTDAGGVASRRVIFLLD